MRGGLGGINLVEEPHSSSLASSTYDHMTRDHVTLPRRGAIMSTLSGYQGVRRTFASPTGLCVQKFDNNGQQNVRSRDGQFNRVVYHWTDVHRRFQYELLYQWDNVVRVEPPRRQVALTV